ncbi:MAG: polysaccharide biosynthesis protein [Clostridia bacterium]|nr:polysaccharide biosynthesis protein [Clostridia bacterium]
MKTQKKQTFVQGALILVAASVIVKVIGACFKIPLTYLINDDGMGLFNSSYQIYTVMFIVATAGFPTAISKMVAESLAVDRKIEADRVFKVAVTMLAFIGVFGSLILFFGADALARIISNVRSAQAIRAISPAVLCVALMAAFRGYFQGQQNMYPTAISEVCESMGKLIFGYLFAWYFMRFSVEKAAAGAVFGVTMGTLIGFFILFIIFLFNKKKSGKNFPNEMYASYRDIAVKLFKIAVPITIGASVSSLTNLADMFTIMNRLQTIKNVTPEFIIKYHILIDTIKNFDGHSINEQLANSLYGMYTGKAVTMFNFPLTIVVALGMSVVPVISGAMAKRDYISAQKSINSVIKITILFAVPCAIGMSVLASPILKVVFRTDLATSQLQKLAISIIFVSMLQITTAVLQAYGKTVIPVINMIIGGVIKVIINYNLVAIPKINIDGAPIGTMICYFVIVCLNMFWIIRETGCKFKITEYVLKPVFSGAVMGAVVLLIYIAVSSAGTMISLVVSTVIGAFVYVATLLIVKAFNKDDIEMMPKGDKILKLFEKFHLI